MIQFFWPKQSDCASQPNQSSPFGFSHFKTFSHNNFLSVPEAILPTKETHFLHWSKTFPSSFPLTFFSFLFFSFLYNPNKKKSKRKKKKKTHIAYLSHFHHLLCTNNNLFFHAFPTTNFKIVYKSYTRKEKKNIKPRRNPDKFM